MKDELGGKIMKKIFGIRAKAHSYLTDNNAKNKKEKVAEVCHKKKTYILRL